EPLEEAQERRRVRDLRAVHALDDVAVAQPELREQAVVADLEEAEARGAALAHLGHGAQLRHEATHVVDRAGDFATVHDEGVLGGAPPPRAGLKTSRSAISA